MKPRIIVVSSIAIAAILCAESGAVGWETDFARASAEAKRKGSFLLLDFSGSDWCGWCKKLEKEVFNTPEFKNFAAHNLVCVLVDFPRRRKLVRSVREQNAGLAEKYHVRGYPTVILLSPEGEMVGKTGYKEGGARSYVERLEKMIARYREQHPDKE